MIFFTYVLIRRNLVRKKSLDLKDNFYYLCTSASNPIGQIHNGGGHVPFLYNFRRHFQFLVCIKSQYRF